MVLLFWAMGMVLVKSAMTIDHLSGGRLEFGLGAGWLKGEYDAIGLQFDSPGTRIARLADVIEGVKAFRGDGPADVSNDTLSWKDFEGLPKPVSGPPIMIGGGAPKILRLAGREADIVSLNFSVYNEWGEMIFQTLDQSEGWDGTYGGEPAQADTYVYTALISLANGEQLKLKGQTTLLR